ncbi:unnamed protein product [Blepharisma stoltei]|uniref:Uncharacterized protein n=1 Tax=Blepharisma stoltei TaxID=1481888 RepID=A0AAU9J9C4_9CILI|nr:unnamed protein product [Blepharisma stoltei]
MPIWTRLLNWLRSLFWSRKLEISIVGLQNAGKTTFVSALATSEFDDDTIPTIGFNHRKVKKGGVELQIWDLGGQPKFRDSWEKYCRNVDCIVFVVDSADFGNFDIAKAQLQKLLMWPSLVGIPLLVIGNKNDLEGALNEEEIISTLTLMSVIGRPVACYSVSSKDMNNLDMVLRYFAKLPKRKTC